MCRFQSRLTNGLIGVDSPLTFVNKQNNNNKTTLNKHHQQQSHLFYMDLIETSKIKYECFETYHLRTIPNSRVAGSHSAKSLNDLKNRRVLVEKCQADGIEEFVLLRHKSKHNNNNRKQMKYEEYYDYANDYGDDDSDDDDDGDESGLANSNEYENYSDRLESMTLTSSSSSPNEKRLYECVQYCRGFKVKLSQFLS